MVRSVRITKIALCPEISEKSYQQAGLALKFIYLPSETTQVINNQILSAIIRLIFIEIALVNVKHFYNFAQRMRRYKVSEVIRLLEADGWYLAAQRGSHRLFKHPEKSGRVTLPGKMSDTVKQYLLNSIWKQAGWK